MTLKKMVEGRVHAGYRTHTDDSMNTQYVGYE